MVSNSELGHYADLAMHRCFEVIEETTGSRFSYHLDAPDN